MYKVITICITMLILQFLLLSCSDSSSDGAESDNNTDATTNSGLTYENFASGFFSSYCIRCHSQTPQNGAPFSLATYNDVFPRLSRIRVKVYVEGSMPPSTPKPTADERSKLNTWIQEGGTIR